MMRTLVEILKESSANHKHICPRQVLGVRMALYAAELLRLDLPRADKRLLIIAETYGCTVDGIIAATGCHVGGRTLRIQDFGKVAATFTDTHIEEAIRIAPRREARCLAANYVPDLYKKWEAMVLGYQVMPVSELFVVQKVQLDPPLSQILSRAGVKATCEICGEDIINGREVIHNDVVLCRACAGESYYHYSAPSQLFQKESVLLPNKHN